MANKLVKGTVILSIATLFTKILGALFWAPFQNIAGDETVGLYRISFPFYTILLMIASAGIPITVSKFVAERLAQGDRLGARRVLKAASIILSLTGLVAFCILFFGAKFISHVLLDNPPTESSLKVLALAILIVPVMAVYRGYFQGHQQMMPTGISQVVEQIVRVGVVIGLTYWMVEAQFSQELVAAGATSGAFAGALGGLAVVLWYNFRDVKKLKKEPVTTEQDSKPKEPLGRLAKQIVLYALPISLGSLVLPLIGLIDSFTVPRLLMNMGYSESMSNTLFGIYGTRGTFCQCDFDLFLFVDFGADSHHLRPYCQTGDESGRAQSQTSLVDDLDRQLAVRHQPRDFAPAVKYHDVSKRQRNPDLVRSGFLRHFQHPGGHQFRHPSGNGLQ